MATESSPSTARARGLGWVLAGNFIRLGAGMGVFVALARILGPNEFGRFAVALASSALICMPVNFGLGTYALRQFGAEPATKQHTLSVVLTARLWIAAFLILLTAVALVAGVGKGWADLIFLLLIAQALEVISDTYGMGFRASSDFSGEARSATLVASVHLAVCVSAALMGQSALSAALGFLVSKVLAVAWMCRSAEKSFLPIRLASSASVVRTINASKAYGGEYVLLTSFTQIDVLIINSLLGTATAGIYQAGMRLVQGFARLAPILAQYILPKLTQSLSDQTRSSAGAVRKVIAAFLIVGVVGASPLIALPGAVTHGLFGVAFVELVPLLPIFGVVLILRFLETGAGLVLVARGLQGNKVWLVAAQLVLVMSLGYVGIKTWGISGWLAALIVSTIALVLGYFMLWRISRGRVFR